ncbi:MAG TPA: TIGR03086 family metal-binding protein [Kutzneria sp.]|jgi:uncharacterized protein (TIGR03086 family)|nr:TIGR03086 family metal-binding protein [Kutzneria sp.]
MDELNRACQSTLTVLAKVRPDQLTSATPCASWDVRGLVNHFVGTAWWATGLVSGTRPDHDETEDLVAAYEASIEAMTTAFAAEGALERTVAGPNGPLPGIGLWWLIAGDQFVHGWDLARAVGLPVDFDPELSTALLAQAKLSVTDALRGPDGRAPFGPAQPTPAGAGPADELAAFLGRAV